MKILEGTVKRPVRICLYGVHGIGKSTFAKDMPKPIMISTEDGADEINVPKMEFDTEGRTLAKTFKEVTDALDWLLSGEHDKKTVVIDTLDELERLAGKEVCLDEGKDTVADIPFGRGYAAVAQRMLKVREKLQALREERKMAVLLISHSNIEQVNPPDMDPYSRYALKLDKRVTPLFLDWVDCIFFVNYKIYTKKVDEKFGKDVNQAVSSGERTVYTTEKAGILAKNRYGLPPEMVFSAAQIMREIYKEKTDEPKPAA